MEQDPEVHIEEIQYLHGQGYILSTFKIRGKMKEIFVGNSVVINSKEGK